MGIEHVPISVGLRRGAVNTGAWEDEHGAKLFLALERGSNALGMSAAERDKFVEKNALPIFDGTQEYCLWLGCMGGYDPKGREIMLALVRVMRYLGASFGVLRKEKCTGDPVRRLGNDLLFQQLAEANLETLKQNKVKKIVSICPHCVRTIQEDWKEYGTPPEVEHHSEFLARHLRCNCRKTPSEEKIVFHDPCYLGRYRGCIRRAAGSCALAGELVEAPRHRETELLLRSRRRAGVSRRGEGRAREPVRAAGAGRDRSDDVWARPAPSAIRCSGMRWQRKAKARRSCVDIAQMAARDLPGAVASITNNSERQDL